MPLNATYLFEKPYRKFHNAEPWWTAYFTMESRQNNLSNWPFPSLAAPRTADEYWIGYCGALPMLVLWGTSQQTPIQLKSYCTDKSGNLSEVGIVPFAGATYSNLIADARLNGEPFGLSEWPNEYLNLRPDVTSLRSLESRQVAFIETKTIGASVRGNVTLYARLVDFLRSEGWTVELYYLLSVGHEEPRDWPMLAASSAAILLWEGVFEAASGSPFGELFEEPLANYVR